MFALFCLFYKRNRKFALLDLISYKTTSEFLSSLKKSNMVRSRYFVQGCSNCTNKAAGISLHACESKRQRDLWVCFVRTKRKKILPLPKARFVVCSAHFEENCFTRAFDPTQRRQIKPGSLPSIWPQLRSHRDTTTQRRVRFICYTIYIFVLVHKMLDILTSQIQIIIYLQK